MKYLAGGLLAAAYLAAASVVSAVTVSTNNVLPATGGGLLPTSTTGTVFTGLIGNDLDGVGPNSRSPFDGTALENTASYTSITGSLGVSSATFDFGRDVDGMSLMWGSPDDYNQIDFFDDGNLVFSLNGADLGAPLGLGFVNVEISDLIFDSAVFRTTEEFDSFEFSNVSAVPLPGAAAMLVLAIGGLVAAKRRRARA